MAAIEKAEAEKIQVVKAAEGDSEAKYLHGTFRTSMKYENPSELRTEVLGVCCKVPHGPCTFEARLPSLDELVSCAFLCNTWLVPFSRLCLIPICVP